MKKLSAILFALLISSAIFAQEEVLNLSNNKLNEFKFNLLMPVVFLYPEISYERILDSEISIGASLGFAADDDYFQNIAFTPYLRWHFGDAKKKEASGFFIEANGSLFSQKQDSWDYESEYAADTKSQFGAGLGVGLGWKYVSRNNWVGETLWGIGRDFINKDGAYLRMGISIGKRF
ncbi:MAG: hypothetical protein LBR48_06440 [Dysgonamonadaceae bacterium]|jgi:hypothetical protein|nr:hypothetical protein [Dysgonamonadaceae bacterium]